MEEYSAAEESQAASRDMCTGVAVGRQVDLAATVATTFTAAVLKHGASARTVVRHHREELESRVDVVKVGFRSPA